MYGSNITEELNALDVWFEFQEHDRSLDRVSFGMLLTELQAAFFEMY
jgi:hypothetical protein